MTLDSWRLAETLAADTAVVGDFPRCRLLLMRDAQYPWCILVPRIAGARELHRLDDGDQLQVLRESVALSRAMELLFKPHKMNLAALGNLVPQLHLHHIARYKGDPAWPAPVWGKHPAQAYEPLALQACLQQLREALPGLLPVG